MLLAHAIHIHVTDLAIAAVVALAIGWAITKYIWKETNR